MQKQPIFSESPSDNLYLQILTAYVCYSARDSAPALCRYDLSKEPNTLSKEPNTLSKEPNTLSKEPNTLSKEPYILSKEPYKLIITAHVFRASAQ